MSLSENEQDDNNIFDQLKSIKAFTVDQLYLLHPDVGCPPQVTTLQQQTSAAISNLDSNHDQNLYQTLVEYEQLRNKLGKLKNQVKHLLRKTFDHIDNVWVFKEEAPRKIGMCQQGKIAETTFKYKQAFINPKQLDTLNWSFNELAEVISKDFIYYSFEAQAKRHKIATQLSIAYQISDSDDRRVKLRITITTLIDFIKHLGDLKSDFVLQCRNWLRCLIKRFLENETTEDYRFIISQLCKGPAGTADWSADLIECKPFEQVSEFESTPQYITHCSILLNELFVDMRGKVRRVTISSPNDNSHDSNNDASDQNWSLVDPRFTCSEELNLSTKAGNTLSESDVIKFCLRIPIAQIFRAYVKKCLESDEFRLETDKNYEYIMLKLLTIGTVIIRTYQTGLETFNSIQYGNLIEYLSSQIRRTVIVLSDQWTEFKRRLRGVDNALLMRLQVEYDNFMLRSILIILELRQSGIWRHLSRMDNDYSETKVENQYENSSWSADSLGPALSKLLQVTGLSPAAVPSSQSNNGQKNVAPKFSNSLTYEFSIEWFKEVSEPMLWHILWQFYHNAFVNSCDYHSDNYWLDKFREKSVVYLFLNKIRDSSQGECSYLINSMTSMLLSRIRQDSKLVSFIATEIFNLSFKQTEMKDKITNKGTRSLARCAEKFPHLISLFISYMVNEDIDSDVLNLFRSCSLIGWICNDEEVEIIARWLIEYRIESTHNKVARLLISKLLLNSPNTRDLTSSDFPETASMHRLPYLRRKKAADCFVDLKLRRKFALLLYEATVRHLPQPNDFGPKSLGTFVEVAFGGLFCERNSVSQSNLIDLALEENYQQFYVWAWRLLFTFRLHILDQPETDWNDVQSRSGTSRSIKNTVLMDDSFHPVPSIQDSECLVLSDGIKSSNPMALYIYLLMTDVTWQPDTLDICIDHLNVMANSGHLTPSLMSMKYFVICHLNDLSDTVVKDRRCLDYFNTVITSSFDATRLASLIVTQLQHLKQYRQLQLSQFYITILLEVAAGIIKQQSSSWFSGDMISLEKIASLLDYIVKFNFNNQRIEIIRKFYDCSYSSQGLTSSNSWFGSLLSSNSQNVSSSKREFLTTLHVLTQKFKKYSWLRWVTTECDTLRQEKLWEDIVTYLSANEGVNLDSALKKVCPHINPSTLKSTLPIYSWTRQIFDTVETDLSHPLCPLLWYNFFLNYFANSLNGVSVGKKLITQETQIKLLSRLDSLFNYHLYKHRNWASSNSGLQQDSLAQLYRAYRLWLQDSSLQDAYVDIDRLRSDYLVPLLKAIMESSADAGACHQYIDIQSVETQNKNLSQVWSTATRLEGNHLIKDMIFVNSNYDESMEILTNVDDEASDAVSLIGKPSKLHHEGGNAKLAYDIEEEFRISINEPEIDDKNRTVDAILGMIRRHFNSVFEESAIFGSNISEFDKIKSEIVDLIQQLYFNKKREHVCMVTCADGSECSGPAKIKFDIEEATIDDRKSQCIQDRQRQGEELIADLLLMPTGRTVRSSKIIEDELKMLAEDVDLVKYFIETLFKWIGEPENFSHLKGSYHPANHLLKATLEIFSNSSGIDPYNIALIDLCLKHPASVQIFSPHLSPASCSIDCFLELYKKISSDHAALGPTAMFVILSKFDVNHWLVSIKDKQYHHNIIRTTCSAFRLMGKQPDDSFTLTFDLYKRHIQHELALPDRRKPEEISLVLELFLSMMDEQQLAPSLWAEFLTILGLEKQMQIDRDELIAIENAKDSLSLSDKSVVAPQTMPENSISNLLDDIIQLAESQVLFDYNSINNLMKLLSKFVADRANLIGITLLEFYQDYLQQFSLVMVTITFSWLRVFGEQYPDNHKLIWSQFMELWYPWIFISKNCQNVGKASYSLLANQFVAATCYMIKKIPDNTQLILQSILSILADYVIKTKEVVYLELTILQRCLKNLPWSSLLATKNDFENLTILSDQENYNISDLVSHILLKINVKSSLERIRDMDASLMPHVTEQLATTIVLQSTHLKGFRLNGAFFTQIPVDRIPKIASLILPKMEFANLEHSQNNKLLVNLLRYMCITLDIDHQNNLSECLATDNFDRSIIYARFLSSYLVDLIRNHPTVLKYHKAYLYAIMDNSLQDLKILLSPDVSIGKKTLIYECLLECCSSPLIDEESRLFIAKALVRAETLKSRPIMMMEIFNAVGKIMSDAKILVYTVEQMISMYMNMNGHYEKVWKSFSLKALPSDLYLEACIEERAPLALLVYFESLSRNGTDFCPAVGHQQTEDNLSNNEPPINNNKILSSFFHWISLLTVATQAGDNLDEQSRDTKVSITWLRLLYMLEPHLSSFLHCNQGSSKLLLDDSVEVVSQVGGDTASEERSEVVEAEKNKQQQVSLTAGHRSLVEFVKQLIAIYDSCNSGGLWSYLKSTRSEQTSRISIIALAVACFLSDRTLTCINGDFQGAGDEQQTRASTRRNSRAPVTHLSLLHGEMSRLRKVCMSKLESARKSKYYIESAHFIEALIESVMRNDKVQYFEGLQLIYTFVKSIYSTACAGDVTCINKILPSSINER